MALHLLAEWRKSGRNGVVFLAENENRAERLGAVIHALDPSCDVLVLPRLNTLPFDQLEPSHEIAVSINRTISSLVRPLIFPPSRRGSTNVPSPTPEIVPGLPAAMSRYMWDMTLRQIVRLDVSFHGKAPYFWNEPPMSPKARLNRPSWPSAFSPRSFPSP